MRSAIRRRLRTFAGPLVLLVICVCFNWRLVLTDQYTWLESPDLALQVLPWLEFQAGEWHQGHIPLWDPYHFLGQPLIGQAQPGVANPVNWLLFAVPLRHGWLRQNAVHWYFVLIHYLGALFMYLLCRDLDRSRWASIVGGCVFAFGGFLGTNDWPQMMCGAIWTPLVFLFLLRCVKGIRPVRSAVLSGVFLGLAWLSGHHQVPIFVTLTAAILWLYFIIQSGHPNWRIARLGAVAGSFMILISAAQTIPALEYGKLAKRWAGAPSPLGWEDKVPYSVHAEYSFTPDSIIGIALPGIHRNSDGFVGSIALALALLAVWVWRDELMVQITAAISLWGLLLALGGQSLVHGVLYSLVPMVEKARSPSMAIVIFNFGIAILTAYGIDVYQSSPSTRIAVYGLIVFSMIVFGVAGTALVLHLSIYNDRVITTALFALIAGGLLAWRAHPAILSLLLFCELALVYGALEPNRNVEDPNRYLPKMAKAYDVVDFLRSRPQPVRVDVDDKAVPYNFGDWYGVEQLGGYLASLTTNMTYMENHNPRAQQLFGVNYSLGTQPRFPNYVEEYTSPSGLKLFRNPDAFPRTWVVHTLYPVKERKQFSWFISDESFDLHKQASIMGTVPQVERCDAAEETLLLKHSSNHVVVSANAACRGMLVIADTFFPGWHATVDGKDAPIYEPYGILRGVVIEKGSHLVDMVYRPTSVIFGALLSALGLIGAIVCQFVFN